MSEETTPQKPPSTVPASCSFEEYAQEIKVRCRHFYGQVDGSYRWPNGAAGDLVKLAFAAIQQWEKEQARRRWHDQFGHGMTVIQPKKPNVPWRIRAAQSDEWHSGATYDEAVDAAILAGSGSEAGGSTGQQPVSGKKSGGGPAK